MQQRSACYCLGLPLHVSHGPAHRGRCLLTDSRPVQPWLEPPSPRQVPSILMSGCVDAEPVSMHNLDTAAADAPIEMKGIRLAGAPLYLDMQARPRPSCMGLGCRASTSVALKT